MPEPAPRQDRIFGILALMIRKQIYIDEQDPRFSTDEDPLLKLVGLVDNPDLPEDIAERHDHFVYGSAERRS